jgi:hypothetical protein
VLLVAPGFAVLYLLQQRHLLIAAESDADLRLAAQLEQVAPGQAAPGQAAAAPAPIGTRIATAVVLALLAIRAIRDVFAPSRSRPQR